MKTQPSRLGAFFSLALASLGACGGEDLPPPDAPTATRAAGIDVVTGPVTLAPLALSGVLFYDAALADWSQIVKSNGQFTWPSPYDITPPHVHFTFQPAGTFTSAELVKLEAGAGYAMEVYLNDVKLTKAANGVQNDYYTTTSTGATFDCPAGEQCLTVSVTGARAFAATFRWDVKLVYWKTAAPLATSTIHGYVKGPVSPVNYFASKIAPIFQHSNCSTCHALGSKQKLLDQHGPILSPGQISTTLTDHGTQLRCSSGCHGSIVQHAVPGVTFGETEWMVPADDMDIDWTNRTASQICNRVKQNLPTAARMEKHFFDDARIAWAVNSGALPNNRPNKGTAPPHSYDAFKTLMSAWINGGQRCP